MIEGILDELSVAADAPARYELVLSAPDPAHEPERLALNGLLDTGLRLEFLGRISCCHCGRTTPKSYGDGYCYRCFRSLARCDLCVLSPRRCHYYEGTCREPAWGEAFCMQPHLVYLANSSGLKVGLTRQGRAERRWLDQGAAQGLVVARTASRYLAGLLEAELGRHVSDRTDWRALVTGEPPAVDLAHWRDTLREKLALWEWPEGVEWLADQTVQRLEYPCLGYPREPARLTLRREGAVTGRLVGMKGPYLLFEQGVFNVRRHRGFHVRVRTFEARPQIGSESQMELFT